MLDEACADVERLVSALGRLTHAAPVPELASTGIAGALCAEAAHLPVTVDVVDLIGRRHHPDLEATVYLCWMEAIHNAIRHGNASRIRLRLADQPGRVTFSVHDDGAGFDVEHAGPGTGLRNMRERLDIWDGRLIIRSSPAGTEISGRSPCLRTRRDHDARRPCGRLDHRAGIRGVAGRRYHDAAGIGGSGPRALPVHVVVLVGVVAPWPREADLLEASVQERLGGWPTQNPIGWDDQAWLSDVNALVVPVGVLLVFISAISLVPRWRRSVGDERQQIKWLGLAALVSSATGCTTSTSSPAVSSRTCACSPAVCFRRC